MPAGSDLYTLTWTGTNGDPWPSTFSTDNSVGTVVDINTNHGRIQTTGTPIGNYDDYGVALWDTGTNSNFEITGELQWANTNEQYIDIALRRNTTASTGGPNAPADGYSIEMQPGVANGYWLARWVASTNNVQVAAALNMGASTTYAFRIRQIGHVIRAKVWAGTVGSGEPTVWGITWVDENYLENVATNHYASLGAIGGFSNGCNMWFDNVTIRTFVEPVVSLVASNQTTSAGTTLAVSSASTTAFPQVGDTVVLIGERDNLVNDPATGDTCTDNATTPNTYTRIGALAQPSGTSTAGAGTVGVMFASTLTTAWDNTHKTVTWTSPSVAARVASVLWISGSTGYRATSIGTGGSTAGAPTATTGAGTPQTDDLIIGRGGFENSGTQTETLDADSSNGTWSATALSRAFTGSSSNATTALTHQKIISQWKLATGAGAQTYNVTNSNTTNVDAVSMVAAFATSTLLTTVNGTISSAIVFDGPVVGSNTVFGTISTALAFSGTAVGTKTVNGTADASLTFAATASGSVIVVVTGTADSTLTFAATAIGVRQVNGTAADTFAFTPTAVGSKTVSGTAAATLAFAADAVGTKTVSGTTAATFAFTATATGLSVVLGTADASFSYTAPANGTRVNVGASAATSLTFNAPAAGTVIAEQIDGLISTAFQLSATAVGTRTVFGAASDTFTFASPATGTVVAEEISGTAASTFTFAGPAVGTKTVNGVAADTFAFTATAAGLRTVTGAAVDAYLFASPAVGSRTVFGQATADFAFDAPITGQGNITGTASADLAFAAPAAGTVVAEEITGTAAAVFTFAAPGSGTNTVNGAEAATLTFSSTGSGSVEHPGTAATALSFDTVVVGTRTVNGAAADTFTFAAPAAGTIVTPGAGVADTPLAFAAPAVGTVSHVGTADTTLAYTATAVGTRTVTGQATATFTFAAPAAGVQEQTGTAATNLTFAAPAGGTRVVAGQAADTFTFTAPAAGTHVVPGTSQITLNFASTSDGTVTRTGTALFAATFTAPAAGSLQQFGQANAELIFASDADGALAGPLFFQVGDFLEHLRAAVETASTRPTFLTTAPEGSRPELPYVVIHQFGTTGPKPYTLDGTPTTVAFYLQVDGVGRNYTDAVWALNRAVSILREVTPPSYVNDMLVYVWLSPFELEHKVTRAVGQRLGIQTTRVG